MSIYIPHAKPLENKQNLVSFEQPNSFQSYAFVPPHFSLVDSHFHLDMLSKRSGDDTLPPYKWRWGGIDYSISHWIYLLAVLQLEFERGRVSAKGRAFFTSPDLLLSISRWKWESTRLKWGGTNV
jgi:hypothetical protein